MKKAIAVLICVFLSLVCLCPAVAESEQYIKVTSENVEFCSALGTNYNVLFTLEKGVYLKLKSESTSTHYKVEYCGSIGYVKISDFPENPERYSNVPQYYHTPITIHFTENVVSQNRSYLSFLPGVDYPIDGTIYTAQDSFNLIGKYFDGNNTFLYLSFQKQDGTLIFGVAKKNDTDWDETANPILAPIETPTNGEQTGQPNTDVTTPNNAPQTTEPTNNLVRVVLIIGICIPAFLIVYLIFKPIKPTNDVKNPRRRQDDYEDFE